MAWMTRTADVALSASRLGARRAAHAVPILVAVVAVALVWGSVIRTLMKPVPAAAPIGSPQAVAWGDKVFLNPAQLHAWLRSRGIPYESWARHHPAAIRVLDPNAEPPVPARGKKVTQPTANAALPAPTRAHATDRRAAAAQASAAAATPGGGINAILLLAYALVTVLLVLVLAPQKYLRPIHVRLNDYRSYAAAVAVGLSAALLAAQFLP
jgi:hypothetical protein